jgi:putative transcriptional regulator
MASKITSKGGAADKVKNSLHAETAVENRLTVAGSSAFPAAPPILSAEEVRALRMRENASQQTFAILLNVARSTVQRWEAGAARPSLVALTLLSLVKKHGLQILY